MLFPDTQISQKYGTTETEPPRTALAATIACDSKLSRQARKSPIQYWGYAAVAFLAI